MIFNRDELPISINGIIVRPEAKNICAPRGKKYLCAPTNKNYKVWSKK